jgi:hypothetical protein
VKLLIVIFFILPLFPVCKINKLFSAFSPQIHSICLLPFLRAYRRNHHIVITHAHIVRSVCLLQIVKKLCWNYPVYFYISQIAWVYERRINFPSFLQVFWLKCCMHSSSSPCVLHAHPSLCLLFCPRHSFYLPSRCIWIGMWRRTFHLSVYR